MEVVGVGQQLLLPGGLLRAAEAVVRGERALEEVLGVPAADLVGQPGGLELLHGEAADHPEHSEAGHGAARVGVDEALVDQRRERIDEVALGSGAQTASTASSVKPPTNTPSLPHRSFSTSSSRP